jgi:hypothetical protein
VISGSLFSVCTVPLYVCIFVYILKKLNSILTYSLNLKGNESFLSKYIIFYLWFVINPIRI